MPSRELDSWAGAWEDGRRQALGLSRRVHQSLTRTTSWANSRVMLEVSRRAPRPQRQHHAQPYDRCAEPQPGGAIQGCGDTALGTSHDLGGWLRHPRGDAGSELGDERDCVRRGATPCSINRGGLVRQGRPKRIIASECLLPPSSLACPLSLIGCFDSSR